MTDASWLPAPHTDKIMPEFFCNSGLSDDEHQRQQLFLSVICSLAAVTLISKAVHLWIAFFQVEPTALSLLYHSHLLRALGIGSGAYLLARAFANRWKWLAALVAVSAYVFLRAPPLIAECRWVGSLLLGTFYDDLLFVCGAFLLVYSLVRVTPRKWRKALAVFLYTVLGLMFLISGLELAHFSKTGLTGSGHIWDIFS